MSAAARAALNVLFQMAASVTDLYELLGVQRNASDAEIRAAYRKLVILYHPDSCGSTKYVERFQQIRSAYDILTNPQRRSAYDEQRVDTGWNANPRQAADQRVERKLEKKRATSGSLKVNTRVLKRGESTDDRPGPSPIAERVKAQRQAAQLPPARGLEANSPLTIRSTPPRGAVGGFLSKLFGRSKSR